MTASLLTDLHQQSAKLLKQADAIIIAAGAGMGVDSGLPDFRGNEGFWKAYPALGRAKLDFTEVASPQTFERDPGLAWGFYGHRLGLYRATIPHNGFKILNSLAQAMPNGHFVFTSNVDGQFQKAGFASDRIYECHGSIHHLQCMKNCTENQGIWPADDFEPDVEEVNCLLRSPLPTCPHCGGLARPNILMFGDWNWRNERAAIQQFLLQSWLEKLPPSARIVMVELGAGTAVPSVRHFCQRIGRDYNARLIRINVREPQVIHALDIGIAEGAQSALEAIYEKFKD